MKHDTGFAQVGDARVAFQVSGSGPIDLVSTPGSFVSFDVTDEDPMSALYFERLASIARIIRFDRRGAGSSDPVPLDSVPDVESYVDETLAVMDTVGSEQAAFIAGYDAGPMAIMLAATHPDRVSALVLINTSARFLRSDDYPIGLDPEAADLLAKTLEETWGSELAARLYVPSRADDEAFVSWFAKLQRLSISPAQAAAYLRAMFQVDVRPLLASVTVPTLVLHRSEFALIPTSHAEYVAGRVPNGHLVELPGRDGPILWEGQELVLDTIEEFLTDVSPSRTDRLITTVVFTDIVDSTRRAEELGDRRWRALLEVHESRAARAIGTHGGQLVKSTGDGFLATFDGPGKAIVAAAQLVRDLRQLGLDTRTGIHTGEVESRGADIAGIGVHLASRIMSEAEPGEIWVSSTVKELVAGSDFHFSDRAVTS